MKEVDLTLEDAIERGLKEEAKDLTFEILETEDENYVLDEVLIPALDKVGNKYDKGELFLPQMIQSAETVKIALNIIKDRLSNNNSSSKGKIIVATVQGDIHDIGKNIVKIFSFYTQAPVTKDQLQFIFHIFHNNILPPASLVFPVGHQIQFHLPRTHNPPACHQSQPHTAAPSDLSPDPLQTRTGQ